jgi:hypothetical protein
MEQLLKITTVPISIEFKVNDARLEQRSGTADLEISRNEGNFTIRSKPIRLNMDTFEARDSIRPSSAKSLVRDFSQKGKSAAYEATATYAQEGQILLSATLGDDALDQIIKQRNTVNTDYGLDFIPKAQPNINWSKPNMTIQYEMDKLNFDWKINKTGFEFIPGSIEFSITQQPDVKIEYVGDPIYVPPSANPNYTPAVDIKA